MHRQTSAPMQLRKNTLCTATLPPLPHTHWTHMYECVWDVRTYVRTHLFGWWRHHRHSREEGGILGSFPCDFRSVGTIHTVHLLTTLAG